MAVRVAAYEVDAITDSRLTATGAEEYRVRWKGYGADEDSWMTQEDLTNAKQALALYLGRPAARRLCRRAPAATDDEDLDLDDDEGQHGRDDRPEQATSNTTARDESGSDEEQLTPSLPAATGGRSRTTGEVELDTRSATSSHGTTRPQDQSKRMRAARDAAGGTTVSHTLETGLGGLHR